MAQHTSGEIGLLSPRTRIASGSEDGTIRVWDANSGTCVVGPMLGHGENVCSVAFSSDGTRIASGSHDKTIRVWDANSGACVLTLTGHTATVKSVCFV